MEEDSEFRRWDDLIPDVLGLIFMNLSLQEALTVIPRVCKSWRNVVAGPYIWQNIDIEQWSLQCRPENIDRMLHMLITRSSGSLRKLCVDGLPNDRSFSFIADNANNLQTLRLPRSDINGSVVEQVAAKLSSLTFLDVSYCMNIGALALEAIGKNCKLLMRLRRKMQPLQVMYNFSQDDEALAIATTMPKLKQLDVAHMLISTESVVKILENCPELELLDLRGCRRVKLDDNFVKKLSQLKVVGPIVFHPFRMKGWNDYSNFSDWEDDRIIEDLDG